jgi:hypothetical protein
MLETPNPIKKENKLEARVPVIPILACPNLASEIKVSPSGNALPIAINTLPK